MHSGQQSNRSLLHQAVKRVLVILPIRNLKKRFRRRFRGHSPTVKLRVESCS